MEREIKLIEKEVKKLKNKKFKVMFFVMDSKNVPIGSLSYIYENAYQLKEMGYDVHMLHAEKDFVGVRDWMGDKYADLPHHNIDKGNVDVSPADVLFIPELYSNVMAQTKQLPCKRVAILQNYSYLTEFIKPGLTWNDLKMRDCIATSESLANRLKDVFPEVQTHIVRPSISDEFKPSDKPKELIFNIVSKNKKDVDNIIKPFYWKYPEYKWVTFREVKNLPKENFAKILREGFATIWCDTDTDFGYSALEAMASGNIIIGKVPDNEPEWLLKNGEIANNGLWFYNNNKAQELIAELTEAFITDNIPNDIYKEMEDTISPYTPELQKLDIKKVYVDEIFAQHEKTMELYLESLKKNNENKEEK